MSKIERVKIETGAGDEITLESGQDRRGEERTGHKAEISPGGGGDCGLSCQEHPASFTLLLVL